MGNPIDKLVEHFKAFPGIGIRQAKRFVYHLLAQDKGVRESLIKELKNLENQIALCSTCKRFFVGRETQTAQCSICTDPGRTWDQLMIVEKDTDLENIEKSGVFKGVYFVLGGTVPVLEETPGNTVRLQELAKYVKQHTPKEIVIALSATPEGENTLEHARAALSPLAQKHGITLSVLGRGLSTGTELEYSDPETIKNALENRK